MLESCNSVVVAGRPCDGHLGKFDCCLDEALYELSMDGTEESTGSGDFEGHATLIVLDADSEVTMDPDGAARTVLVPAGNYLLWEASSGRVTVGTFDTADEAREVFEVTEARYILWDNGCDPNDADAHEACAEYDGCRIPEWVDA